MNSRLLTQTVYLARRSVLRTARQPAVLIPAFLFPMLLFILQGANLDRAADLPGFPADSYFAFLLTFPLIQGVLFSAVSAGTDIADDIESGFMNRLSMTPMNSAALLVGQLFGVVVLGIAQAAFYLAVGAVLGVDIKAGIPGILLVLLYGAVTALGFGGIGAILALRTGSGEAVQGLFPLLFVVVFLSNILLPLDLIGAGWFQTVATYNPISYLVQGIRSLIITGWEPQKVLIGFVVSGAILIVGITGAAFSLKERLART
ncbi:ABC transporter permease [Rubrobacter aplysinae]|uniref:ABC transporter permease n=1 Tax=Rubrobacter aplysinae TaxID=909625 RepID=UPI00064BAED9|nr:ABC transporter permease [Rubrobacter aplysinae]